MITLANGSVQIPFFILAFLLSSCGTYEDYAAKRTGELRKIYPPGVATRFDVQNKWRDVQPDFTAQRPNGGWVLYPNRSISKLIIEIESKSNKQITSISRYWGPYGTSSLSYCWYFFDSLDRVIDVRWQYKSD